MVYHYINIVDRFENMMINHFEDMVNYYFYFDNIAPALV